MAAGVRVTQGAETGAGREVARRWGEDQTSLSPKASEGEAGETEDSAGGGGTRTAVSPQPLPGDELGLLPALLSSLEGWGLGRSGGGCRAFWYRWRRCREAGKPRPRTLPPPNPGTFCELFQAGARCGHRAQNLPALGRGLGVRERRQEPVLGGLLTASGRMADSRARATRGPQ